MGYGPRSTSPATTQSAFCLLIDQPPAGWSLPAHRHQREAETIHVVEGEFEIEVDGYRSRVTAGETIHIPRGAVHASANIGHGPGRRMVVFSPAGMEQFFLETGASSPDAEVDADAALASASRHGWEFITERRPR